MVICVDPPTCVMWLAVSVCANCIRCYANSRAQGTTSWRVPPPANTLAGQNAFVRARTPLAHPCSLLETTTAIYSSMPRVHTYKYTLYACFCCFIDATAPPLPLAVRTSRIAKFSYRTAEFAPAAAVVISIVQLRHTPCAVVAASVYRNR